MNEVTSGHVLLTNEIRRLMEMIGETRQRVLSAHEVRSEDTPPDTEAVHDFRVALRRTRTMLRIGRILWSTKQTARLEEELGYYARITGTLRDDEVLRALLASLPIANEARATIDLWLAKRARAGTANDRSTLRLVKDGPSERQAKLKSGKSIRPLLVVLDKLERLLSTEPTPPRTVAELATAAVGKAVQGVKRAAGAGVHETVEMHSLRIREKRLRYTAELFADVLGEDGKHLIAHATRMQRRLGDLHDVDEAIATIKRARGLDWATKLTLVTALGFVRSACSAKVAPHLIEARALGLPVALSCNESLDH